MDDGTRRREKRKKSKLGSKERNFKCSNIETEVFSKHLDKNIYGLVDTQALNEHRLCGNCRL